MIEDELPVIIDNSVTCKNCNKNSVCLIQSILGQAISEIDKLAPDVLDESKIPEFIHGIAIHCSEYDNRPKEVSEK